MKPIICDDCAIAVHPGCILRVNHPSSVGRLTGCVSAVSGPLSTDVLSQISELIRAEFAVMKEEWKRLYRADVDRIDAEILKLSNKVDELENKVRIFNSE